MQKPPSPIIAMRDTLSYHVQRRDFHQKEIERWEKLLAQATVTETARKEAKPEAAPIKANGRDARSPEPLKKPQSKSKFVENTILTSGILGITAAEIRKKAKSVSMHVATNFPYRQANRMIEAGKVWKDSATGRYFHATFTSPPESSSAQETSH